jgi:hypothetical protein
VEEPQTYFLRETDMHQLVAMASQMPGYVILQRQRVSSINDDGTLEWEILDQRTIDQVEFNTRFEELRKSLR